MIESRVEMVEINGNDFCNFTKSANHYCFLSSFYICNCCVAGWATTTLFFLINIDSSHSLGEGEGEGERERERESLSKYFRIFPQWCKKQDETCFTNCYYIFSTLCEIF